MPKKFSVTLRETYSKLKHPIAIILIFIVVFAEFFQNQAIQVSAISILGLMIVEMLFDIHKAITKTEAPKVFSDFFSVSVGMRDIILDRINRKREVHIRALGMSMGHAWQFLVSTLLPILLDNNKQKVILEIAMLDSQWNELLKINPDWVSRSAAHFNEITRFIEDNRGILAKKGWSIKIYTYRHVPNWHGILVDDDTLFLSSCFWTGKKLSGGENQYEMITPTEGVTEQYRIRQFKSWFDYIQMKTAENNNNGK